MKGEEIKRGETGRERVKGDEEMKRRGQGEDIWGGCKE